MRRMIITGLSIVALSLFILFACGGDPAGVTSPISVTSPTSSTVWEHYQADATVTWSGGTTDNVSIKLVRSGEIVATLATAAPNTGSFILPERVSTSWSAGNNYIIRIEDVVGEIGNSSEFEIAASAGEDIIQVTNPSESTEWCHYQEDLSIAWSYPSTRTRAGGSISINNPRSTGSFSGSEVDIELYQGDNLVLTLASGVSSTAGSYIYSSQVPSTWGTGSDYKVKITDDLGNYGYSSDFNIVESSGQEVITVTQPNSSTDWQYQQAETTVTWEYPDKGDAIRDEFFESLNGLSSGKDADSVRIEVWHEGSKLDDYTVWVANTGSYTRTNPLSESWSGSDYQIKVIDSNSNYGISEYFNIGDPSGDEIIIVVEPNSSTEWEYEQTGVIVEWSYPFSLVGFNPLMDYADSVRIEIWHEGNKLDNFSDWVSNTGSYTRTDSLPSSWCGSNYQIKVIDLDSNHGTGENFIINEPSGEEVILVTEPNSSTEWEYEQTGTVVEWSYPFSTRTEIVNSGLDYADSVRIEIWHEGSKLDDYSGWIANTGSYTRTDPLPSSWCGSEYKIKVIDFSGNYGMGENFVIADPFTEEIISVTEPNSSTLWDYEQVGATVEWNYPFAPGTESFNSGLDSADSVRIEIWYEGSKLDDFSDWIDNSGSYTRTDPLPSSWFGTDYQIKVIDLNSNYGTGENFEIAEPSGEEVILVTEPNASTEWEYEQIGTTVEWSYPFSTGTESYNSGLDYADSVRIEIWHEGSKLDDYSGWVNNTGSYTRTESLPSSWSGSDYRIKVIDSKSNYGTGENFDIGEPSAAEIIIVTEPNSSTVWDYEQTGTTVEWSYPFSTESEALNLLFSIPVFDSGSDYTDSVRIEIWHEGVKLDDFSGWISNTGSYTRTDPLPSTWFGTNYQIEVIDSNNNYGTGESFEISEPTGSEVIIVTDPNSSTIWDFEQAGTIVEWSYPYSLGTDSFNSGIDYADSVRIEIWHTGLKLDDYSGWVPNTGSYTRTDPIPSSWSGSDYQIKVIDSFSNHGTGDSFEIEEATGSEIIIVTEPNSSTVWDYEETGTTVEWSYPFSTGSGSANLPFSILSFRSGLDYADSVRIEIWHEGIKLDDFAGWISNTGSYTRADSLPSSWSGSDFQIKVIDSNSNYGTGENFEIGEPSGAEIIIVTEPNSSTEWECEQTGTTVEWSFPFTDDSGSWFTQLTRISHSGTDADSVRVEIWLDSQKLDDYSGWIPNTGSYTRSESLPLAWGPSFNYQIKVIDSNDNYGTGENFLISGSIDVTTPDSSTVWNVGEENTQVSWSGGGAQVKLELWYSDQYTADFSGWINNTGSYTRSAPIPSSWSIGEHFRIRVVEPGSTPNDGFSEEFQITDVLSVTAPDSASMWAWGEEGATVQWSEAFSDSILIDLYKDSSYIASFCDWIPNTGSYIRTTSIPSLWGTGDDYRLRVSGNLGTVGFSDEFSIWSFDVFEPNILTEWFPCQPESQVHWTPGPGSFVRMEIWNNEMQLDDYCGWTENDGNYSRPDSIPVTWVIDDGYRIKMIDDLNNVGWSEEYSITFHDDFEEGFIPSKWIDLSGSQVISTTNPYSGVNCLFMKGADWSGGTSRMATSPEFSLGDIQVTCWVRDLYLTPYFGSGNGHTGHVRIYFYDEQDNLIGAVGEHLKPHQSNSKWVWAWIGENWDSVPSSGVSLCELSGWIKLEIRYSAGTPSIVTLLVNDEIVLERDYSTNLGPVHDIRFQAGGQYSYTGEWYIDDVRIVNYSDE